MNTITQFNGESRRDAIVNHFSLDVEVEDGFFEFIKELGYDEDDSDEMIESLYEIFKGK